MKIDDFQYMCRGKKVADLSPKDAYLLQPVMQKSEKHERALLLLHGFTSSPAVYRRILPRLKGYDALFCPLLPGHGESIDAFSKIHARDWTQYAEQLCHGLLREYKTLDVMGLSLGGLIACHLSQQFKLHHLYLLAPALILRLQTSWALRAARLLYALGLRRIPNRAGSLYTSNYSELAYEKVPIACIIEILSLIQQFQFTAPSCPVDVFLGRHDPVVHSEKIAKLFKSHNNIHLHWLEHSAHVLPLDGDLDNMISVIERTMP